MSAGKTEEETEKRVGAALLMAQPLISIDNVNGTLGGDCLCQAVEREVVMIRILGRSEAPQIEPRGTTFFATGNNIAISGDMTRRAIRCTLDRKEERPELHQFKGDPVKTVLADRASHAMAMMREEAPEANVLVVAGGVAANGAVRAALAKAVAAQGFTLVAPPVRLCTDNAVMVAWTAIERLRLGLTDELAFAPRPRWPL